MITKNLKKELVNQIYSSPEKKVIVLLILDLTENFLIYIDEIRKC